MRNPLLFSQASAILNNKDFQNFCETFIHHFVFTGCGRHGPCGFSHLFLGVDHGRNANNCSRLERFIQLYNRQRLCHFRQRLRRRHALQLWNSGNFRQFHRQLRPEKPEFHQQRLERRFQLVFQWNGFRRIQQHGTGIQCLRGTLFLQQGIWRPIRRKHQYRPDLDGPPAGQLEQSEHRFRSFLPDSLRVRQRRPGRYDHRLESLETPVP